MLRNLSTLHAQELHVPPNPEKRARVLASVTLNWSSTPEVECRAGIRDAVNGDLIALEREGLIESRKAHTRHRQWRLKEK